MGYHCMCTLMVTLKTELIKMGSVWNSHALLVGKEINVCTLKVLAVVWKVKVCVAYDLAIAFRIYIQDTCVYICPKKHAVYSKKHCIAPN